MKAAVLLFALFFLAAALPAQQKGAVPFPATATATATAPATATVTAPAPATRAVVVGISDYQDPGIPDLRFADRDAEAFAAWLRTPTGGSVPPENIQVLLNKKATLGKVAMALTALYQQSREGDLAVIYFSGHGDVETKTVAQPGYWLCWDAPPAVYMSGGSLSLWNIQDVVTTLSLQNKARVLIISDACHAGKLAGSEIGGPQATAANLAKQFANEVKILSCQPGEFSLEGAQWGGGRGCFSYHLTNGLYGLADRNEDDLVTLFEMETYLGEHVPDEAAPHRQFPFAVGDKMTRLARVDASSLARIRAEGAGAALALEKIEPRGMEDWALAKVDSTVRELYAAFNAALEHGDLLTPKGTSADDYYRRLINEPELVPLHGLMTRNFAATLVDESQQVTNKLLKTDPGAVSDVWMRPFVFDHIPAQLARAIELLGEGHYLYKTLKAKQLFFEGLSAYSKDGSDLEVEKRFETIREKLERAMQMDSSAAYIYAYMSWFYIWGFPDRENSFRCAIKAVELTPNWALANLETGLSFTFFGYFNNDTTNLLIGERYLLRALELDSTCLETYHALSHLYWACLPNIERHHYFRDKLIVSVQGLLQSEPETVTVYQRWMLGTELYKAGRNAEAAFVLEDCERRTLHRHFGVYQWLGAAYGQLGQYDNALRAAKKQIELNPYNLVGYGQAAEACRILNRPEELIECLEKGNAILQFQRNKSIYISLLVDLGEAYEKVGREREAQIQFNKFIKLVADPVSLLQMNCLGRAYLGLGNRDAMQRTIEDGLKKFPNDPEMYYQAACLYFLAKDEQKALEYLETALLRGFNNYDQITRDPDLENLRDSEGFKVLRKRYFLEEKKE